MTHSDVIVNSPISSRNAAKLVQKAGEFKASVWISCNDRTVNAKSLLGILSLKIETGTTIKVFSDGEDEREAVKALSSMIENNFEEDCNAI